MTGYNEGPQIEQIHTDSSNVGQLGYAVERARTRFRSTKARSTQLPMRSSCLKSLPLSSIPVFLIQNLAVNERQMVLVRTDFTDPSQDASATNNQIISWTYHSPFSGFSYLP